MTLFKNLLVASLLAMSAAAPALAAPGEETTLQERNVYLFMDGKMVRMAVSDAGHAMAMKMFKPLPNGTMIYRSGGKLYMASDSKMDSGKMLSTELFGYELLIRSSH